MGRARVPSARALEAAEAALHAKSAKQPAPAPAPAPKKQKKASPAPPPATKPGAKSRAKGSAARGKGKAREEEEDETMSAVDEEDEPKAQDQTLYCICLGYDTGAEPMIQCEYCANWFHFGCVGLNAQLAEEIDGYSCDFCQQMGHPPTRKLAPIPVAPDEDFAEPSEPEEDDEEEDRQSDSDAQISGRGSGSDQDSDAGEVTTSTYGTRGTKRAKRVGAGSKRRKIAEEEAQDLEDDDYVSESEERKKPKSKAAPKRKASATPAEGPSSAKATKPSVGSPSSQALPAPPTDKTRTACRNQLSSMFKSVFTTSGAPTVATEARAAAFAEEVEGEMFDSFGELDSRGSKGPRTKYLAKFRSLHFNLKTNPTFRSRVAANELAPAQIVNLTNEDLLTPELRAMAETVRAASLKDSLREAPTLPTAKRTHKGEEEIDGAQSVAKEAAAEEKEFEKRERVEREKHKERLRRASEGGAEGSPVLDAHEESGDEEAERTESPEVKAERSPPRFSPSRNSFGSPKKEEPSIEDAITASLSAGQRAAQSRARSSLSSTTNVTLSAEELGIEEDEVKVEPIKQEEGAEEMLPPSDPTPAPVAAPRRSASFDMASIWSKVKSASPAVRSEENTPMEVDEEKREEDEEEYDPFSSISGKARDARDDEDFDAELLRDREENTSKLSTPSKPSSAAPVATTPSKTALKELDKVWEGDLIVPEEGGFPGLAVQTGGRCLGPASEVWRQLLPRGLTMDGRIPTLAASKYLVECSFAPGRELVLVTILPDLSGPSTKSPLKPSAEKCQAKYSHVINFYKAKDRVGVIQPPVGMKQLVKDIYIVPLAKADPLPDYVELLDEADMLIPRERKEDMLLGVLVVKKGALPTYVKTGLTPAKKAATPTAPRGPSRLSAPPINAAQQDEAYIPGIIPGMSFNRPSQQGGASSRPPPPPSGSTPLAQAAPTAPREPSAGRPTAASMMPAAALSPLPVFDQAALDALLKNQELLKQAQSLLANPALLASLGGLSPAPARDPPPHTSGLSPHAYAPQAAYGGYDPSYGRSPQAGYAPPQAGASPWGQGSGYAAQPYAGASGGGYEPQASLGWNSGARSPMPGQTPQSPPRQAPSGGAGFVHPSRLAMMGGQGQSAERSPPRGGPPPGARGGGGGGRGSDQGWGQRSRGGR